MVTAMTTDTLIARLKPGELAGKTLRQLEAMKRRKYRRLFKGEEAKALAGQPMSRARAEDLLRFHDSYSRLREIMLFSSIMNRRSWLALLGANWSICDNLSVWVRELRRLLPSRTTFLMMNEDERATWRALPKVVTVYRGCSKANLNGLSWSLDRDIAAQFPALDRYMPPSGSTPLLVTADVAKGRITAVNLGRNEQEIITLRARVTWVVEL